ncbi:MAG: Uma2 family endonuclease [Isosphaeraceae bacterium]
MSTHELANEQRLVLGPDDHGRIVSDAEFDAAYFSEPWTYERIKGKLIVMSPDGQEHIDASEPWNDRLVGYKLSHPEIVQTVKAEAWMRIEGGTDRIADIGVYLVTDRPVPRIPERIPDLVFEALSPGREAWKRDFVEKRADYHRLGVREYVVIDRFEQQVTVFTHTPRGYDERVLNLGDVYTSPLFPALAIPLADVLPS